MRATREAAIGIVAWLTAAGAQADASDLRLIQAVKGHDLQAARTLVTEGADVNAVQPDGTTALHWAAYHEDAEAADLLIHAGARVNATNDLGATPLWLAAAHGSAAMIDRLLSAGADPNLALAEGETPLMAAARAGSARAVTLLVEHGADVNARERVRGQTALMWAVAEHHPDVVQALLAHHADVSARSVVRSRLINAGADGTQRLSTDRTNIFEEEEGGFTPLLFAAQQGDVDSAALLVAAGADVNDRAPTGASALVVAAHSGHPRLVGFLLDKGADPNSDAAGYTALHAAIVRGDLELTKTLLARGANANAVLTKATGVRRASTDWAMNPAWLGATPLWLAAKFADVETMRVLARLGAAPGFTMPDGTTVLMAPVAVGPDRRRGVILAPPDPAEVERRTLAAVTLAAGLGVDVNAANAAGDTALHGAASRRLDSVIQFLANRGARLDVKNKKGQTPLAVVTAGREQAAEAAARTADLLRKLGATE